MRSDLDAATQTLGIDSDDEIDGWYRALYFEAWGIDGGRSQRKKVANDRCRSWSQ